MNSKIKKSKKIPKEFLPRTVIALYTLNDGRIVIGGDTSLLIYNMKTYKVDINIELDNNKVKYILELNGNKLFYFSRCYETEGPHTDEYFYNNLIEITGNSYKDLTNILPSESKYNIIREYSDKILFGGISYSLNYNKDDKYYNTNVLGEKRIEKILLQDKYQIINSINIDFIDFILLNKNLIAVLLINKLEFYDTNELIKIKSSKKISNLYTCTKMSYFSENLIIIGTTKNIEIFDYKNFMTIKTIFCVYPIKKIFVNKNILFIGESSNYNYSNDKAQSIISEYEIDENGNYKQIDTFNNTHKYELIDFTQVDDGRLITTDSCDVKIWS